MNGVSVQCDLYFFFYMIQCDMVYFMVDYGFNFVVGYYIYQFVVDVNIIVCYGKCVDVFCFVNFIVYWLVVNVIFQCGGNFCQLFSVFVVCWCDFCFVVEFLIGLIV